MTASIRSLMGPPTPAVHANDSVVTAARKLRAHATDTVLVHGDRDEFIGTITRGDIIDQVVADGADPAAMTAGSLITAPGAFAAPNQDAGSSVIELILRHRASFLPVVDEGRLVGIVTLDAIAVHLVECGEDLDTDGFGDCVTRDSIDPDSLRPGRGSQHEELRRRA